MKKATIIVFQEDIYNSLFETLYEEVLSDPDVFLVVDKPFPESGFYRYLASRKLKKITFGLSNNLYCNYYNLPAVVNNLKKEYDHISILMHNASLIKTKYPIELINILKKEASLNILYIDVHDHDWTCSYANYLVKEGAFDKVFTIDPADAEKHHMALINTPYSLKKNIKMPNVRNQIYYCGSDAGRMFLLHQIWQEAKKRGVALKYDLSFAENYKDFFDGDPNVRFNKFVAYEKVLDNVLESSCVLDITQKDQSALTVRPYEAVAYNKKLLTNNKNIFDFKYYDSRYIQYFEKVEDINWDWLTENVDVNYHYQGDFSPRNLLDQLA